MKTIKAIILALLNEREHTVSSLWDSFLEMADDHYEVTYDWFVLALDLLYALGAMRIENGVLQKWSGQ